MAVFPEQDSPFQPSRASRGRIRAASIVFGLLGFFGSTLHLSLSIPPLNITFLWSLVFPLLAARAWGIQGALFAALPGLACFFPFLIWANNGWSALVNAGQYLAFFLWIGWSSDRRRSAPAAWNAPPGMLAAYLTFYLLMHYTLFAAGFSWNPPPWNPATITAIPAAVLHAIALKAVLSIAMMFLLSEILLQMPGIRRLLALPVPHAARHSGRIIGIAFLFGIAYWLINALAIAAIFQQDEGFRSLWDPTPHQLFARSTALLLCLAAGLVVARVFARRNEALDRLAESEAKLRLITEHTNDVIWKMDANLSFTYISPSVTRLRGISVEQALRETLTESLAPAYHELVHGIIRYTTNRIAAGDRAFEPITLELEQMHADGSTVPIETTLSILLDEDNHLAGAVGVTRDIRSRKKAEREQAHLETQLRQQQKLSAVGTLANGVAHEINNPLMSVINFALLIKERATSNPDAAVEYAGLIAEEGERIAAIVRNLLRFSRHQENNVQANDMKSIIENVFTLIGNLLEQQGIIVEIKISGDLPAVRCAGPRIEQVLLNLVTNARDALNERYPSFDPGKKLTVSLDELHDRDGRWIRTTITDAGIGISESIHEDIFNPFFTTKGPDQGTGLGLAISHGIVAEHGGRLHFESALGKGTAFFLDLPAGTETDPDMADQGTVLQERPVLKHPLEGPVAG